MNKAVSKIFECAGLVTDERFEMGDVGRQMKGDRRSSRGTAKQKNASVISKKITIGFNLALSQYWTN